MEVYYFDERAKLPGCSDLGEGRRDALVQMIYSASAASLVLFIPAPRTHPDVKGKEGLLNAILALGYINDGPIH